jgi:ADP-heptose:LPS heptosyltransferase/GT2 family glycosyltransferase
MAVDAPTPTAVFQAGATIEGHGWAMAGTPVKEITIALGGTLLCRASVGIERPDLVEAFPAYADAGRAGFIFSAPLDTGLRGPCDLVVRAITADGRQHRQVIPISIAEAAGQLPDPNRARVAQSLERTADDAGAAIPAGPAPVDPSPAGQAPATTVAAAPSASFHVDKLTLSSDGELYLFGWAIAEAGVQGISVNLNGNDVHDAVLGLIRTDIAELYPTVADAGRSGFGLRKNLGRMLSGEQTVELVMRESDGRISRWARTVDVEIMPAVAAPAGDSIQLAIDLPSLPDGGSPPIVSGNLAVQGWALARAGVQHVAVSVNAKEVGFAYFGIRREDVAAVHTDWPDALHCGFGISIPAKAFTAGRCQVAVCVTDTSGGTLRRDFEVLAEQTTGSLTQGSIRSFVSGAEARFNLEYLSKRQWRPRFDCLVRAYGADRNLTDARATLASLASQIYENWRATVFVDEDTDTQAVVAELQGAFAAAADRIVVVAGNARAAQAPTDVRQEADTYCCMLEAGDRLGCDALMELALSTSADQSCEFLYFDDRRQDPVTGEMATWFKPDWSPDLLLSANYIGRSWCARSSLLERAGIDVEDGEAVRIIGGYDLVLRLTHAARRIARVPAVLAESSGASVDTESDREALIQALASRGIGAAVEDTGAHGVYRVKRAVARPPLLSIIIPTCGTRGLIRDCIASIRRYTDGQPCEIICVENIPEEQSDLREWLRTHAEQVISLTEPFNWSRFNNLGAAVANAAAPYLLFLNDDIEAIEAGWLDALLEHAQREDVGVVGPMLLYPDLRVQHAGMFMVDFGQARHAFRFARAGDPGPFGLAQAQRNVLAVTGACMMIRRAEFEAAGGFDAAHRIVNNDVDYCLRSHARGRTVVYTPNAKLIHHEMASRRSGDDEYDVVHFERCWGERYAPGDPFYSPSLSRTTDDYAPEPEPVEVVFGGHPLIAAHRIRSILAVKLDHIGDFITALPAMRRLKQHFPDARLCLLAGAATAKLARLEPSVDETIEFDYFHARSSLGQVDVSDEDLERLRARLSAYRFDLAIDLRKHADTRNLLRYAGATLTAGYDFRGRFPWLDIALEWEGDMPLNPKRQHIVDDLLRLVDAVGTSGQEDRHTIAPETIAALAADARPPIGFGGLFQKPVVCIHAASGNPVRQWPIEHFAGLTRMILAEFDVHVALIGGHDEAGVVRKIAERNGWHRGIHLLAGVVSLTGLPQLLSRCVLFVGNNSGPQHIAAGLGVSTIGVHSGVVDAVEWAPIGAASMAIRRNMSCSPCYLALPADCRRDLACLNGLAPRDVMALCRKLLLSRDAPRR